MDLPLVARMGGRTTLWRRWHCQLLIGRGHLKHPAPLHGGKIPAGFAFTHHRIDAVMIEVNLIAFRRYVRIVGVHAAHHPRSTSSRAGDQRGSRMPASTKVRYATGRAPSSFSV